MPIIAVKGISHRTQCFHCVILLGGSFFFSFHTPLVTVYAFKMQRVKNVFFWMTVTQFFSLSLSPVTCCSWCAPDWQCLSVRSDITAIAKVCTSETRETPPIEPREVSELSVLDHHGDGSPLNVWGGQCQQVLCGTQKGWLTGH